MKTKSVLTLAAAVLLLAAPAAFSSTGIFGTGVAISSDIGGTSTFNLYEITLLGDGRLAPTVPGGGVSLGAPTLVNTGSGGVSTWATGGSGQPTTGPSLGTFTQGVDTLTLNGGELLTYKNSGSDVTGAFVEYSIDGGAFTGYSLGFNQDNVNGNSGDQRWYSDGENVNLLNGLSTGTHTLSVYFYDNNNFDGSEYVSNGAHNYNALFTIITVPEPAVTSVVAAGFGLLFLLRRRR
jgi:hypothetical protein